MPNILGEAMHPLMQYLKQNNILVITQILFHTLLEPTQPKDNSLQTYHFNEYLNETLLKYFI